MADPSSNDNDNLPLPPGWSKGFSRSQKRNYYCHAASNHTQWHFPTNSEALDPLKAKARLASAKPKSASSSSSSSQKRQQPGRNGNDKQSAASSSFEQAKKRSRLRDSKHTSSSNSGSSAINDDASCVAIIVPYRDVHAAQNRARHLQQFIPRMHTFLQAQVAKGTMSDYHIYIVEQSNDNRKFNRGKLLNIGFDIARKNKCRKTKANTKLVNHDVFIFHDVDLLPSDVLGSYYTQFPSVPIHIARVWDRYSNNPKYFGGIVSFSESDMKRINGYPNTFWGWGGEDDEMQLRCEKLGIKWEKPQVPRNYNSATSAPLITDLEQMDLKEKLSFLRQNKKWKCMVKWEALEEHETTWRRNGLADLNYSVLKMTDLDERVKNGGGGSGGRSRATKITVDVKLNANHWANEKCSMDYVYSG
mmetsp:Transcript_23306/g.35443  ORF Transcript_23306/g.35443 Transcript_23306/m.35443 type:complete len:417 (+) Transcript_23306:92-1342(+)